MGKSPPVSAWFGQLTVAVAKPGEFRGRSSLAYVKISPRSSSTFLLTGGIDGSAVARLRRVFVTNNVDLPTFRRS
jgi:hypothetical protein